MRMESLLDIVRRQEVEERRRRRSRLRSFLGTPSEWFILIVGSAIAATFWFGWRQSDRKLQAMQHEMSALAEVKLARMDAEDAAEPVTKIAQVRPEPDRWYQPWEWDAYGMGRLARSPRPVKR